MRNYWYIPTAVLLVLVLVGFFAGWVQLSLGPDTWAVPFTTSRGFGKSVIGPSGFTWRWERLVPHALTLYRISLSTERADAEIRSLLPSAEAYSALMPERPDFSVDIKLSALYRIRPDALPGLVGQRGSPAGEHRGLVRPDEQRDPETRFGACPRTCKRHSAG